MAWIPVPEKPEWEFSDSPDTDKKPIDHYNYNNNAIHEKGRKKIFSGEKYVLARQRGKISPGYGEIYVKDPPVKSLFENRLGLWFDPQDLTTMYQDAAGVLPVYRPGSGQVDPPVGLALDKSKGLELGPELAVTVEAKGTAGYTKYDAGLNRWECHRDANGYGGIGLNPPHKSLTSYILTLKTFTHRDYPGYTKFVNGAGLLNAASISGAAYIEGGLVSLILITNANVIYQTSNLLGLPNVNCAFGVEILSIREIKGYHAYQATPTARPKLSGRYSLLTATETLNTQSVTTAATDYTFRFEGTGTVTLSGTATGVLSAGTHTITCTEGTLTLTVAGSVTKADLRASNDGIGLPPYQRVDSATTYDTNGFPLYLRFDGVDDFLQTANVDLTGTDAFVMGIGTRKLSDAARGGLIESSVYYGDNPGSFILLAPNGPGANNFNFAVNTTGAAGLVTTTPPYKSPNTQNVICKAGGGSIVLKVGATDTITTSLPPGNFGSYPLYIGSRAGTNAYFNGRIYSLCIIGSLLSTAEQSILERYLNTKTRAY